MSVNGRTLLCVRSLDGTVGSPGLMGGRRVTNHSAQFREPSGRLDMPSACCIRFN